MAWRRDEGALTRWLGFSSESLSKIEDIELATLKIHLVLEDASKSLLAARLAVKEDAFFDLRIDFSTLVDVALEGAGNSHLVGALRALNTARNYVSHHVESSQFMDKLALFVRESAAGAAPKSGPVSMPAGHWPNHPKEQFTALKEAFDEAAFAIFDLAINGIPKAQA